MKRRFTTLLAGVALTAALLTPASAELHEFTSKDGAKTFWGHLTGYDAKQNKVAVHNRRGKFVFSADILSEKDQEWVKAQYEI